MSIYLWRLTHLWLAVICSVFVLIASVTGAILSFEPIYKKSHPFKIDKADDLSLASVFENLKSNHEEILSFSRDKNGFVLLQTLSESKPFYVNPKNGEKIGEPFKTPRIFDFCRSLHRSLFLGKTGRFLIGVTSVFLLFIAISGFFIILKKQGGIRKYFSKVVKNDFYKDYHTRLSRWMILSIMIIALTGTYLFLERFDVIAIPNLDHTIDETTLTDSTKVPLSEFEALDGLVLGDLREVNFPFDEFPEEYYELKLRDREVLINQFSGKVISQINYPFTRIISLLSLNLHTGEGTILWALVLFLTAISILFLTYSGFAIYLRRDKTKIKNPFTKDQCHIVILVGSEQGSTLRFANAIHHALLRAGRKSYLSDMDSYEEFESLKYLIVLTSTYGVGEAPANAGSFVQRFKSIQQSNAFEYSVLGFGSTAYPDFCQFAIEVDKELAEAPNATALLPLEKVNNESKETFLEWSHNLGEQLATTLSINESDLSKPRRKEIKLKVSDIQFSPNKADQTFLLKLEGASKAVKQYQSGDLLSILPKGEKNERLYSMSVNGKEGTIQLSIRKHPMGLCSTLLSELGVKDSLKVSFKKNEQFHFPSQSSGVIMISNGTGIAPFLGMIENNSGSKDIHLFWGVQNRQSEQLYTCHLAEAQAEQKLSSCKVAYSREGQKQYVQDLIKEEAEWIVKSLKKGYAIMMCGGLSMQKGVEEVLDHHLEVNYNLSLDHFREKGLIKTDCY